MTTDPYDFSRRARLIADDLHDHAKDATYPARFRERLETARDAIRALANEYDSLVSRMKRPEQLASPTRWPSEDASTSIPPPSQGGREEGGRARRD